MFPEPLSPGAPEEGKWRGESPLSTVRAREGEARVGAGGKKEVGRPRGEREGPRSWLG